MLLITFRNILTRKIEIKAQVNKVLNLYLFLQIKNLCVLLYTEFTKIIELTFSYSTF